MLGLRVGDIIASEKDVREPLMVYVEGKPKFLASPGQVQGPQGDPGRRRRFSRTTSG